MSFIEKVYAFVADIHLRPDSKEEAARFISWLSKTRIEAEAVYILGDLFDYWYTGLDARFQGVLEVLRSTKVCLLPGNRDFLLRNADLAGITIHHTEEKLITMNGIKVLLAHGHTLTEADAAFRLLYKYGWPMLWRMDRWLSLSFKDRWAKTLVKSSAAIRPSSAHIRQDIEKEKGVDMVICAHLHRYLMRPGLIVLPAFYDSGAWLAWDESGPRLCSTS